MSKRKNIEDTESLNLEVRKELNKSVPWLRIKVELNRNGHRF